jgi:hypothetical protein
MAWSNQVKSTDSFSNQAKNSPSFSNQSKNTSTQTNQDKISGLFFLLQQIGDYILQENGYPILLEESMEWNLNTKNTSSFTNLTKH